MSFPLAKKPICLLSGDQKGNFAPSVPAIKRSRVLEIAWTHNCVSPDRLVAV